MNPASYTSRCINPKCGVALPDGLNFCPLCGKDQRAPKMRVPLLCPGHTTVANGQFCTTCGAKHSAAGPVPVGTTTQAMGADASTGRDAPSPIFAWLLAFNWFLYWPLLQANLPFWGSFAGCLVLNVILIFLDVREIQRYGRTAPKGAAFVGFVLTPIYLIARSLRTKEHWPALFSAAAYCLFLVFLVQDVRAWQERREQDERLQKMERDLGGLFGR